MTKIANVEYDPMAECPTWIKFLERIMKDEHGQVMHDLIEFLQRMIGYTLTGSTREHCLFILHGSGSNGKSTFFSAIEQILGDYAERADASTFMVKNNQGVPNDIARLRGCRMVQTSESENNKALAESLIKQLTGGDKIVARFLHQEFFEFTPKFKILFATNHKPRIKGNDHAIWRRIRLIPFKQTISDEEKDPHLVDKLQAEASGILKWAIDGCLKWMQDGLKEPEIVKSATQAYRAEMDFIQAFFDEHIEINKQAKTSNKDLYAAYRNYSNEAGEYAVTLKVFGEKIKEKIEIENLPIRHVKDMYGVQWMGIKLIERDIFNDTTPKREGSGFYAIQ
jgi:putative DNA primase/helicase